MHVNQSIYLIFHQPFWWSMHSSCNGILTQFQIFLHNYAPLNHMTPLLNSSTLFSSHHLVLPLTLLIYTVSFKLYFLHSSFTHPQTISAFHFILHFYNHSRFYCVSYPEILTYSFTYFFLLHNLVLGNPTP